MIYAHNSIWIGMFFQNAVANDSGSDYVYIKIATLNAH